METGCQGTNIGNIPKMSTISTRSEQPLLLGYPHGAIEAGGAGGVGDDYPDLDTIMEGVS